MTMYDYVWLFKTMYGYRASQKKLTFCIFWISQELRNGFLNRFFLLKTEIHVKTLNTEPFLCDIRGLRYLQNKIGFRNRQVHIHTDLKCSSQHQNGSEMPHLNSDWPDHVLRGPKGPRVAQTGLSGVAWARQWHLGANLALLRPFQIIPDMTLFISESYFVL